MKTQFIDIVKGLFNSGVTDKGAKCLLPWSVIASIAVLLLFQLLVIGGLRGVDDQHGYGLNTSKKFGLNVYEDDGIISLYTALGYNSIHGDRFSYLFGIGGPVLHLARPVMSGLDALGFITRFEDPELYQLYPQALDKCYRAFALYQLLAFTLWLPAAGYLLLSRHVSPRAGFWGAWLVALTPFLSAFETRIKPDTPALLFGLLCLYFGLNYARSGRKSHLFTSWALMGLSFSIKLTCVPLAAVLIWLLVIRARRSGVKWFGDLSLAGVIFLAVFLAANPLVLFGLDNIVAWMWGYLSAMHSPIAESAASKSVPATVVRNLFELQVFFGPVLRWFFLPVLVILMVRFICRGGPTDGFSVLSVCCFLQLIYIVLVGGSATLQTTYYYYAVSILGLLLIACCLDFLQTAIAANAYRRLWGASLVFLVLLPMVVVNVQVVNYVTYPSNRQMAHGWIESNLPEDASVGVRLPSKGQPVNQYVRVNPFRYQVETLGIGLEHLEELKPRFLLLESGETTPNARIPHYNPIAIFAQGDNLPRSRVGMFQDEPFIIFERLGPSGKTVGPASWEHGVGSLVYNDPERNFNLLQYQAMRFYPITVNLLRKQADTLVPFPMGLLARSLRHESSPVAYVHHVGPATLTLWGVKYVWAMLDEAFTENVLQGKYPLSPVELPGLEVKDHSGFGAFLFEGYLGQALFAPDTAWDERKAGRGLVRLRPLPGAGKLISSEVLDRVGADMIEVRLEVDADAPVDVLVKGGGERRAYVMGAGQTTMLVPYEVRLGRGSGADVEYEINPTKAGGMVRLLTAAARPMSLHGAPLVTHASVTPREAFATVAAPSAGRVFFALPWHRHWVAQVDSETVLPQKGPAGVVAVPVPEGTHFVALYFKR
ncbi:MAG: glycosyltransferase family 39 protein [Desulfovibrio sp.]|nr:glycosyltransferase family 39 protein [Desulfovibrio sp.]MBI4959164.1 glycosyltransferase family 39 protein [Desulfovibrio sp.]